MSSALTTSVESCRESMDQPTILRLNASRTAAQYTHLSLVRCCVMSVTHNSSGRNRWNLRLTRSSAVTMPRSRLIRTGPGRPWIPACVISTDTVLEQTRMPMPGVNSAWMRREP